jgi:hypothetical protein
MAVGYGLAGGYTPQIDPNSIQTTDPSFMTRLRGAGRSFLGNRDLALALLANSSGPQRQSFGSILGQSMMQADQMKQGREDDAFKRQYMQAQMAAMGSKQRKLVSVLGPDGKPVLKYEDEAAGMTPYAGGADSRPSAFIQAYDRYLQGGGKLPMMDFAAEFAKNNAQYPYQVGEVAGEQTLIPRTNPAASGALPMRRLSTLPQEAGAKRELAQAGAAGSTTGEKRATAEFDLPRVESNIDQALADLTKLKEHPGLVNITGLYSKAPIIPGTKQAAADALAKQVQGQTFLQAYNALKGAGAITETEGAKAEASVARLERAQSTDDYRAALDDLAKVLKNGKARLRGQAGAPAAGKNDDPLGIR